MGLDDFSITLTHQLHPDLGISYISLGTAHINIGDYLVTFLFYECVIDIELHSLPLNNHKLQE